MFGHQLLLPIPDVDRAQFMLMLGANPLVSNGSLMTAPGIKRPFANKLAELANGLRVSGLPNSLFIVGRLLSAA